MTPEHAAPARRRQGFTSETARAAGLKSAETRRKKRDARTAEQTQAEQELATFLQIDCTGETLGTAAREAAALIIGRVLAGRVNITDGRNAAALLSKCHEIARLEAGQVTALTGSITLQLDDDERRERLARARASIDAASSVAGLHNVATSQVSGPSPADADTVPPSPHVNERVKKSDAVE